MKSKGRWGMWQGGGYLGLGRAGGDGRWGRGCGCELAGCHRCRWCGCDGGQRCRDCHVERGGQGLGLGGGVPRVVSGRPDAGQCL